MIVLLLSPITLYGCSYSLLEQCWSVKPQGRPAFSEIVQRIDEVMEEMFGYIHLETSLSLQ